MTPKCSRKGTLCKVSNEKKYETTNSVSVRDELSKIHDSVVHLKKLENNG